MSNWPRNKVAAHHARTCFFLNVLLVLVGSIYFAFDPWSESVGHVIGAGCLFAGVSFLVWTFFWTLGHIEASMGKETRALAS